MKFKTIVMSLGCAAYSAAPASAQTVEATIGSWVFIERSFPGSDDMEVAADPIIMFRAPGEREWLNLLGDDGGQPLIRGDWFAFGPSINIVGERSERDSAILSGLGNVDTAYEVGGFAEIWPVSLLRTRIEARHGIGGHEGVVLDFSMDAVIPVTESIRLTLGPRLYWADDEFMDTYFGISPTQAAASNRAAFSAESGFYSAGVAASLRYKINETWALMTYVEFDRLIGDAADSPITQAGSEDVATAGAALTYTFTFDRSQLPW